jgi:uncharacterized protein YbbC (DUF1343 family)
MRKCIVLFVILVVALVFAAISESKEAKLKLDLEKVVAKK